MAAVAQYGRLADPLAPIAGPSSRANPLHPGSPPHSPARLPRSRTDPANIHRQALHVQPGQPGLPGTAAAPTSPNSRKKQPGAEGTKRSKPILPSPPKVIVGSNGVAYQRKEMLGQVSKLKVRARQSHESILTITWRSGYRVASLAFTRSWTLEELERRSRLLPRAPSCHRRKIDRRYVCATILIERTACVPETGLVTEARAEIICLCHCYVLDASGFLSLASGRNHDSQISQSSSHCPLRRCFRR